MTVENDAVVGGAVHAQTGEFDSAFISPSIVDDGVNVTINSDINLNGNLYQVGDAYETHAEQIYTTKDEIILRDGAISGLGSAYTGLRAKLYDGVNDGLLVWGADGFARVGDVGDLKILAARADTIADGNLVEWDTTTSSLIDSGQSIGDITGALDLQAVTDNGNSTTNAIGIGGAVIGSEKLYVNGNQVTGGTGTFVSALQVGSNTNTIQSAIKYSSGNGGNLELRDNTGGKYYGTHQRISIR